jgi:cation diffusion facilitator CzcD-associated flavoprotein CzcO
LGAGFGGLAAAIRLRQAGYAVTVLERAAGLGGTWHHSVYPGCACDVASHLYSLSFELNPDWSRSFASQPEIRDYLERVADKHGVRECIRFGSDVARVDWQGDHWHVTCRDGHTVDARFVVSALGALRDPRLPALPGRETFRGPSMHSGLWDSDVSLQGKRIGVIGTGASAIQIVPALAELAGEVHVFQRTPAWVVPRRDRPYGRWAKAAFRHVPGLMQAWRLAIYLRNELRYPLAFGHLGPLSDLFAWVLRRHIRRSVDDPVLAERLIPPYQPGCKRILISDDFYPALNSPHVHLHGPAESIAPDAVVTEKGSVEVDILVFCTGYRVDDPLGSVEIHGRDGRSLRQYWGGRPRAHLGITIPGFPNLFGLLGPNTALGHNSVLVMIEAQVRYLLQAIHLAGTGTIEPKVQALDAFMDEVDSRHSGQVWMSGCQSWYLNSAGENFTIWPASTLAYLWRTRKLRRQDFVITGRQRSPATRSERADTSGRLNG